MKHISWALISVIALAWVPLGCGPGGKADTSKLEKSFQSAAVDEKSGAGKVAGFAIGLTITLGIIIGGPLTGAALNPARAFGPALAAGHWANHGIYWVGPLAGGFLAGLIYDSLFLRKS